MPADVRALIRELSTANPLWGAPRIHGELQKLGISVSQSTVAKYMRRHPRPPSQTWRTFLTNHASQIMAADLFVVPTVTFRLLFVLVILAHDRRRIVHVAVTEHPTAAWTAQQLRNAFPDDEAPGYLLHDRDAAFADVATTIAGMNIQAVRTAPRSPWQNAYVERVIGSIRRECLDHVIVVNDGGAAAGAHRVRRVLHALAHASRAREGRADARAPSSRRRPGVSSRRRKSADSTTATIAWQRSRRSTSTPLTALSCTRSANALFVSRCAANVPTSAGQLVAFRRRHGPGGARSTRA